MRHCKYDDSVVSAELYQSNLALADGQAPGKHGKHLLRQVWKRSSDISLNTYDRFCPSKTYTESDHLFILLIWQVSEGECELSCASSGDWSRLLAAAAARAGG